jgi:hypothetical protein
MRFVVLISPVVLMACYQYAPVESVSPQVGTDVLVHVSSRYALELGVSRGDDGYVVTGELFRSDDDTLGLRVPERGWSRAYATARANRVFLIPRAAVVGLEAKRIQKWKTAALIAGGVGGLAFLLSKAAGGRAGGPGDPPPPDVSVVGRLPW